ncbi:MAG: hypothetical protein ABW185_04630 [Sedimenticola sp.]
MLPAATLPARHDASTTGSNGEGPSFSGDALPVCDTGILSLQQGVTYIHDTNNNDQSPVASVTTSHGHVLITGADEAAQLGPLFPIPAAQDGVSCAAGVGISIAAHSSPGIMHTPKSTCGSPEIYTAIPINSHGIEFTNQSQTIDNCIRINGSNSPLSKDTLHAYSQVVQQNVVNQHSRVLSNVNNVGNYVHISPPTVASVTIKSMAGDGQHATGGDAAARPRVVMSRTPSHGGVVSGTPTDVSMCDVSAASTGAAICVAPTKTSWSAPGPVLSVGHIPVISHSTSSVRVEPRSMSNSEFTTINDHTSLHEDVNNVSEDDDFWQHVRKPPIRYYIGGFKPSITENKLYNYVTKRGPSVTTINIFRNRRNPGAVTIRLNVESDSQCRLIEDPYFWPDGIICKPWVNNNRYRAGNNRGSYRSARGSRFNRNDSDIPDYVNEYNPYLLPDNDDIIPDYVNEYNPYLLPNHNVD